MTRITFVEPDGREKVVEARDGLSLMENAQLAGIDGIVAECGGSAACATCHVVLSEALFDAIGKPEDHEEDMLDFTDAQRQPTSRLSCQVIVTPLMHGATVTVPKG